MRRAIVVVAALLGLAPLAAGADEPPGREIVDLGVRPYSVTLAALPLGQGWVAAYDDRLELNALRFAERRNGVWRASVVASEIDGRRVGREPVLAVSPTGLRVLVFRTDMSLSPSTPPSGALYVARAFPGNQWFIQRLDGNGFGASIAFDRSGRPAIAYLARTGTDSGADVRLAQLVSGEWTTTTLAHTTYRVARNGSNASRVGLAFDRTNHAHVAYVHPGSHAVRLATPGLGSVRVASAPARSAQAAVAFGAGGAQAVAFGGLAGDNVTLSVAYRRAGRRWSFAQLARDGATAPSVVAFAAGRPVVAFRDAGGIAVASPRRGGTIRGGYAQQRLVQGRYSTTSTYAGALGAARSGTQLGLAFVAPRGLLEFTTERLPG